jgi:hypothetical protein
VSGCNRKVTQKGYGCRPHNLRSTKEVQMAVAVPRQFEIAKTAVRGTFSTKKALAKELESFTKRMIREGKNSAFQKIIDNQRVALRASTISSYVSVA